MNKLIDIAYFRSQFDISEDITDSRLKDNIGAASRRLRQWVSDEVYQSVLGLTDGEEKKDDFRLAEANIAMHFAILGLNSPITSKGIIKTSKAKDMAVLTYFTPDEIRRMQNFYLEQAEEILRPYREYIEPVGLTVIENVSAANYGGCQG